MLDLFITIFKIGLFTFGGGAAMLAILEDELVKKKKWLKRKELLDYYAIGQSTPGIIAINTATLVGYKLYGIKGGLLATFAMILPSIIVISVIASFFDKFLEFEVIKHAFGGIRIVVSAIIIHVVFKMWKGSVVRRSQTVIFIVSILILLIFAVSPFWVAITSAVFGYFYYKEKKL